MAAKAWPMPRLPSFQITMKAPNASTMPITANTSAPAKVASAGTISRMPERTINIDSTSAFTPLFVQGNAGNDTINLGTGAHNLDYLRSAVHVRAWGSTDRINLFDDAAGYDDTYTINASGVSRYIFGGLDYANSYGNAIAQVSGKAGAVQRHGAHWAAAHSCHGYAQQGNAVIVFEGDGVPS